MSVPKKKGNRLVALLGLGAILLMAAQVADAQLGDYPNRAVQLIIPYPPGGSDALARKIAATMAKNLGKEIVPVNVPGASTQLASRRVKEAKPDGYTIYVSSPPEFASGPALYKKLPFDPLKDFTLITFHAQLPYLLLTSTQVPVKTVGELTTYLKSNLEKFRWGSYGAFSQVDLLARRFRKASGINFEIIPYSGGSPAFNALLAGEIHAVFATPIPTRGFIKDGKMLPLAVTSAERSKLFPSVPTLLELGFAIEDTASYGLVGPPGLPKELVAFWNREWSKAMNEPETRKFIEDMGVQIVASTPEYYRQWLVDNTKLWVDLAPTIGVEKQD